MERKSNERMDKKKRDKFVRYSEGAEMYHMSQSKFMQLAKIRLINPAKNLRDCESFFCKLMNNRVFYDKIIAKCRKCALNGALRRNRR